MVEPALRRYRSKRDFSATPEPAGEGAAGSAGASGRFVIHEHHARSMHWDLRLEREGVLVSWAVPKGLPEDPAENHLAVHVEDHPVSYLDFAGEIPEGNYGAGSISIWDEGTYEAEKFRDDEVIVVFSGRRAQGRYALFQTGGKDGKNWMIHRMDPAADPAREPMPDTVAPMLATAGSLPADETGWAFEIKWDGIRALALIEGGRLRLLNRTGRDVSARYPELRDLGRAIGTRRAVLDGEIIAPDERGRPDFGRLQSRMHVASDAAARRLTRDVPVVLMLFDVIFLDAGFVADRPYARRRELLEGLGLAGAAWQTPDSHPGDGAVLLQAARDQGLEGVVAKRTDAPYEPGRRSAGWRKVKAVRRQELVVGGWLAGDGNRASTLGALLVGFHDEEGRLRFAGRVGTGFRQDDLARLTGALAPLAAEASPFAAGLNGPAPPRGARWVAPELVVEVEFAEWTHLGTLRHPSFKGLRDDRDPASVVREPTA